MVPDTTLLKRRPRLASATRARGPARTPSTRTLLALPVVTGVAGLIVLALGLDHPLLLAVNAWPRVTGETPWAVLSMLGEGSVVLALGAWIALRRPELLLAMLLTALFSTLGVNLTKDLFASARPLRVLAAGSVHVIGPHLAHRSFPSGHACAVFAAAFLGLAAVRNLWTRCAVFALAVLVALSRLAVGAHWPVDVLAGAALGWLAAGIALLVAAPGTLLGDQRENRVFQVLAAVFPLAASVRLFAYREPDYSEGVALTRQMIGLATAVVGALACWRIRRAAAGAPDEG